MTMSFKTWILTLLVALGAGGAVAVFLGLQGQTGAAVAVGVGVNLLVTGWIIFGIFRWRELPWVRRAGWFLLFTAVMSLAVQAFHSIGLRATAATLAGAWGMTAVFVLGLLLLRLILRAGHPVVGIARTTLDEAVRMKAPLALIGLLIALLPALPLMIPEDDQLRYRLQTYLAWSMFVTSVCLSLMTIFLAVGTVTSEIQQRRIFLTLTKPVGRGQYIAGKWLGISLLNAVLVAVAGLGIYVFTVSLGAQVQRDAKNQFDALAVREQVLVARQTVKPTPAGGAGLSGMFNQRLEKLRQEDPATYGSPGDPADALSDELRGKIEAQVVQTWYTIGPQRRAVYRFAGLDAVPQSVRSVQLRFKPKAAGAVDDGFVRFAVVLNGRPYLNPYDDEYAGRPVFKYAEGKHHVLPIPREAIGPDGVIEVELFNVPLPSGQLQPSITFNPKDGLEMLYRVDSFEMNLMRSMWVLWLRLVLLSMLGIAAGTFLGFPVACLVALLFYLAAAGHGYITESISYYSAFPKADLPLWDRIRGIPMVVAGKWGAGEYWDGIKVIIRMIGSGFLMLVPSFAEHNPAPLLADGRNVSWRQVGDATLWVGLIWTGVLAVVAFVLFKTREIARVIV